MTAPNEEKRSPSLSELIVQARSGDEHAQHELFRQLLPRVRKIVALRMGCREDELCDRDDFVQETLKEAFVALPALRVQHEGAVCHWLAASVENNLRDHQRRRFAQKRDIGRKLKPQPGGTSSLSAALFGMDPNTPSRFAQANEMERAIESCLRSMPDMKRRVIEMRLRDMAWNEITKELGLGAESSARSLYCRSLAELSQKLGISHGAR